MKKFLIVDITGRVELYDLALAEALYSVSPKDVQVKLLLPKHGLLSLIPKKLQNSENAIKRAVKVGEALLNYLLIIMRLAFCKVDILHLQWLPFMEINAWENPLLALMHKVSARTRIVLTIHNVYPHNMDDNAKQAYNKRFRKACSYIDAFIVHTDVSKKDVTREFNLPDDKVTVCCHGVFVPKNVAVKKEERNDGKCRILQFGTQSYYKGTDVLVDAICGMPNEFKNKIETRIVGDIKPAFLEEMKAKDSDGAIVWKPYFLDDQELYEEINNCDIVALPYRAISQSGVLLLAIYFEKNIICSNLPSFVETMRGNMSDDLDDSLFFESENADSLRHLIMQYISKDINEEAVKQRICHLKHLYSWESAAHSTLAVYNK